MLRVRSVDPHTLPSAPLQEAAMLLREGGLVAFPTETVYGLGAQATNPEAVARIFAAKGRPADNPLIVHVAQLAEARACASRWPELADRLAAAFWPGPLTLIVPKHPRIPDLVTAGLPAVGLRIPAHPVAMALLRAAQVPVAAPSANPYMAVSPTLAQHVIEGLGAVVDLILDGGPCTVGIESTVLDLTGDVPVVLRPGGVSLAALRTVAPETVGASTEQGEGPQRSPGLARRHYAPSLPLELVGDRDALCARAATDPTSFVLSRGPCPSLPPERIFSLPDEPHAYAAGLYAALHDLGRAPASRLLVEAPPEDPAWDAVRDRLRRAAEEPLNR